jgi:hypothetical protein
MTTSSRIDRLTPLSGIAFVALMVGVISFEGQELDSDAAPADVLAYWSDRADTRLLVAFLSIAALLFLLVFAASLRGALRSREPAEASASVVTFAGAVVAASGLSLSACLTLAASRAGDAEAADAVVPLDHLVQSAWLPITAGFAVMVLAAGVGGLRSGTLPKAVCWAAMILGIAFLTPAGIVAFLLLPLWILAVSVVLFRAQSRQAGGHRTRISGNDAASSVET